jgi:mutator protein MutT
MSAVPVLVVAAVIHLAHAPEKILIVRRGPGQSGAGFWEFPGGKVELGESPEQALHREIEEELGIQIKVQALVGEELHHYPTKSIRLRLYQAETLQEKLTLTDHDDFKWCKPAEIPIDELSAADRPFVSKIMGSKN